MYNSEDDISSLHLSNRSENALRKYGGITTVGELCRMSEEQLRGLKNLGEKSVSEIMAWIRKIQAEGTEGEDRGEESFSSPSPVSFSLSLFAEGEEGTIFGKFFSRPVEEGYVLLSGTLVPLSAPIPLSSLPLPETLGTLFRRNSLTTLLSVLTMEASSFASLPYSNRMRQKELHRFLEENIFFPLPSREDADDETRKLLDIIGRYEDIKRKNGIEDTIGNTLHFQPGEKAEADTLVSSPSFLSYLSGIAYSYLEKNGMTGWEELGEFLSSLAFPSSAIMEHLLEGGLVMDYHGRWMVNRPTFREYLESSGGRKEEIVLFRANGHTLDSTGEKFGLSRERVRQLEQKVLRDSPPLWEDGLRSLVSRYAFTPATLTAILGVENASAFYLAGTVEKGAISIEELSDDSTASVWLRKRAWEWMWRDAVKIEGTMVRKERRALFEHALRLYSKDAIAFDTFNALYRSMLERCGLDESYSYPEASLRNKFGESPYTIISYGHTSRFYDKDAADIEKMLRDLELESHMDVEISAELLFRRYPDVMEEYDIRNGYELHNLLKSRLDGKDPRFTFLRTPNLVIGKASREEQVRKLLEKVSPIPFDDFAILYSETYGNKVQSVKANYMQFVGEYLEDGILTMEQEVLENEEYDTLREALTDDAYSMEELSSIFASVLPERGPEAFTAYTIRRLGFTPVNALAYRSKYGNADSFFRHYLSSPYVDFSGEKRGLLDNTGLRNILLEYRRNLTLVEYGRNRFVHISELGKEGITREEMEDFAAQAASFSAGAFFSVHSLMRKGFSHMLLERDKGPVFLNSVLFASPSLRRLKIGGGFLFCETERDVSAIAFHTAILLEKKSITLEELEKSVREEYGISLVRDKVIKAVRSSSLLYNEISGKIYLDWETYRREEENREEALGSGVLF